MIVEKPAWLRHEGLQIFSIDIQPTGHRFATAGGDHKVRIWDMKYLSRIEVDPGSAPSKLLATLRDHFGSVNCVRWSKQGRLIASGSDDQIVLIHERRSGSGTTEFGSGEPPDVENWKVLLTLRGHTADVVDLGWNTDDSLLASCSLDNTIHIWNMSTGSQVTILKGHTSLVKGIAWDPVGSFLASQSDDKTVIIWRASDWSLAQRIEGHWEKTVGSTFFRRLDWSPCGHFITTTNGFQKPRHSAPVLERGDWTVSYDFLGHNAPIVAVRFNQSLFSKQPQMDNENDKSVIGGENGLANGNSKPTSKDSVPYNVIAMGSQDCSITVWTTTSARPVFVGKHFFTQSVVDLAWSPDGYSLFCCSLDGSVSAFHFEVKELGYKYSERDMDELKKNRYGESRGRQTTLAESPAQLLLESVAAKKWGVGESQTPLQARSEPVKATNDTGLGRQQTTSVPFNSTDKVFEQGVQSASAVSVIPPPPESQQKRVSSPIKQREYRRPDGRRRIIPEPVGPQVRDERIEVTGMNQAQTAISGQKRDATALENVDAGTAMNDSRKEPLPKGGGGETHHTGTTNRASANSFAKEAELCSIDAAGISAGLSSVQRDVVVNADGHAGKGVLSISVSSKEDAGDALPVCFEARPLSGGLANTKTEVVCSQGGEVKWRDKLTGRATVISGNSNMWAVGCQDGTLQVYTKGGRRAMPSIVVGSAPVFMDCTENSRLLLLTRQGSLHMWDCIESRCILKESVLPLLALYPDSLDKGSIKIVSIRISRSGAPLVVLANQHAFLFHVDMQCWERVADDQFHGSSFFSLLQGTSPAGDSELAFLQAAAAEVAASNRKWNRIINEDKSTTRAHLETQMASAVALKSPKDYQNYLLAYTRFLAREADEVRLRELCMELLGPPFPSEGFLDGSNSALEGISKWQSSILGLKKQELLKSHVLPAMASNRRIQRLLNEVLDLVSELEARQQALNSSNL